MLGDIIHLKEESSHDPLSRYYYIRTFTLCDQRWKGFRMGYLVKLI